MRKNKTRQEEKKDPIKVRKYRLTALRDLCGDCNKWLRRVENPSYVTENHSTMRCDGCKMPMTHYNDSWLIVEEGRRPYLEHHWDLDEEGKKEFIRNAEEHDAEIKKRNAFIDGMNEIAREEMLKEEGGE